MVDTQQMLDTCVKGIENGEGNAWEENFVLNIKAKVKTYGIDKLSARQVECLEKIYNKFTA